LDNIVQSRRRRRRRRRCVLFAVLKQLKQYLLLMTIFYIYSVRTISSTFMMVTKKPDNN